MIGRSKALQSIVLALAVALCLEPGACTLLDPCAPMPEVTTAKYGARVSVFNMKIDRLQVLRFPYPDVIYPMLAVTPPTMTVIAFRDTINSVPAYIASADLKMSEGAGFAISLSLLLKFDLGVLQYLQWYDTTCNSCGGSSSQLCLKQTDLSTCATPLSECTCSTNSNDGSNLPPMPPPAAPDALPPPPADSAVCDYTRAKFDVCSASINVGWVGTDKHSTVFYTGSQIQRVNSFSLVSIYFYAQDKVLGGLSYAYNNIAATWGTIQIEGLGQSTQLGGGIGQRTVTNPVATASPPPAEAAAP